MQRKTKLHASAEDMIKLYEIVDEDLQEYKTVCEKECCYCCCQIVPIYTIETNVLKKAIKALNASTLHLVKKQYTTAINHLCKYIEEHDLKSVHQIINSKYAQTMVDELVYCPFLINKKCAIYQLRPFACRFHLQMDNPDLCKENWLRGPHELTYKISFHVFGQIFQQGDTYQTLLILTLKEIFERKRSMRPITKTLFEKVNDENFNYKASAWLR